MDLVLQRRLFFSSIKIYLNIKDAYILVRAVLFFNRLSRAPAGSFLKASFVGANNVNGPPVQ